LCVDEAIAVLCKMQNLETDSILCRI